MPNASHTIREEIHGVVLFVGAIWAVYLVSLLFPGGDSSTTHRIKWRPSTGRASANWTATALR